MTSPDGGARQLGARPDVIRAAASIAALDAADRLLSTLFAAYPPVYLEGVFDQDECLPKASKTARELRDYTDISGARPEDVVQEAAFVNCQDPDWSRAIAEAMALAGRA